MDDERKREDSEKPSQKKKKQVGVMDIILIIVFLSLLVFTVYMIKLFEEYGAVPDTLITSVFCALGGECGIMGWIKTTKDRSREHQWEQEDKQAAKAEEAARMATAIAVDTTLKNAPEQTQVENLGGRG